MPTLTFSIRKTAPVPDQDRLRVVFDAYWWVSGPFSLMNVLHGIVETWSEIYPHDELIIIVRRRHQHLIATLPSNVSIESSRLWPQALLASLAVPWFAHKFRANAMLSHNFAPLYGRRRGLFLHDVMFETNPQWFTRLELLYFRWMTRLASRATVTFATSRTESERIRNHTHAHRVVAVGLGISAELTQGPEIADPSLRPERYILVVGRLNARKNLKNLLEGARQSGLIRPNLPLVIIGDVSGASADYPEWLEDAIADQTVIIRPYAETPRLKWLLANCALFVCLSLDEGFGLPPVEAVRLGARVLVSDIPVFRETLGDLAVFVDPRSPMAIARAMTDAMAAEPAAMPIDQYNWPATVGLIRAELGHEV